MSASIAGLVVFPISFQDYTSSCPAVKLDTRVACSLPHSSSSFLGTPTFCLIPILLEFLVSIQRPQYSVSSLFPYSYRICNAPIAQRSADTRTKCKLNSHQISLGFGMWLAVEICCLIGATPRHRTEILCGTVGGKYIMYYCGHS